MKAVQAEVGEQWLPKHKSSFQITADMLRLNLTSLAPIKIQVMPIKTSDNQMSGKRRKVFLRGIF